MLGQLERTRGPPVYFARMALRGEHRGQIATITLTFGLVSLCERLDLFVRHFAQTGREQHACRLLYIWRRIKVIVGEEVDIRLKGVGRQRC